MSRLFPKQVMFDLEEIYRINRVRIAKWLHITPGMVDAMPAGDVEDVMQIMWADEQEYPRKGKK